MAYRIDLRERTGFNIAVKNTLTIKGDNQWGAVPDVVNVKVYNPYGETIHEGVVSVGDTITVPLTSDEDNNAIQGNYRVEYNEEVTDVVLLEYAPKNAVVNAYANGYLSRFTAVDVTDWDGYIIDRTLEINPPAPMNQKAVSGSAWTMTNIYSGVYNVLLGVSFDKTQSNVRVYDATVVEQEVKVYPLTEKLVYEWVDAYMDEYVDNLDANPREAKRSEPTVQQVALRLSLYEHHVKRVKYREAYANLEEIRALVNPDGAMEIRLIEPFVDAVGSTHTHDNLGTLNGFRVVQDSLYWGDTLIGGGLADGQVKMDAGSSPDYLEGLVDNSTISNVGGVLTVGDAYLENRLGSGLYWDGSKVNAEGGSGGSGGSIAWSPSVRYSKDDVVTVYTDRVRMYRSCKQNNMNRPPIGGSSYWEEILISENVHIQNRDFRLGNEYIAVNLSTATAGILYVDWANNNAIKITKNDATSDLKGLIPLSGHDIGSVDLPSHDITIYVDAGSGAVTFLDTETAGCVSFNNKGNDLTFVGAVDWVRYRYNVQTTRFDLVATSLKFSKDEQIVGVVEHLNGDDSTYNRFSTSLTSSGNRMAIRVPDNTSVDTLSETGLYYCEAWLDYPSGLHADPAVGVGGWVQVYTEDGGGLIQEWLGVGKEHPSGGTFNMGKYKRYYDLTAFSAWNATDGAISHTDLLDVLGDTEGGVKGEYHLTQSQFINATSEASSTTKGLLSSSDYESFVNKQDALTLGNIINGSPNILEVALGEGKLVGGDATIGIKKATVNTSGYLSSEDWDTFNSKLSPFTPGNLLEYAGAVLNVSSTVKPVNDADDSVNSTLSAAKIYELLAGDTEVGTYSKSYTVIIPAGADLATKLGFTVSIVLPTDWTVSAVGGNGGDLKITHAVGQTPASISVYRINVDGSKSKLEGTVAYGDASSNTNDTVLVLSSYANTSSATEIRITF